MLRDTSGGKGRAGARWGRIGRPAGAAGRLRRLALVAVVGLAVAVLAAPRGAGAGSVNTDALNLRAEPGTWGEVLTVMTWGEWVEVLAGPTGDGWYQVAYGGMVGWAYGGYLALDGGGSWSVGAGGGTTAWVSTDGLNVRRRPWDGAPVRDVLPTGTEVTIVGGEVSGFVPIGLGGGQAWVWAGYLTWDGTTVAGTPVWAGSERWIDVDRSSGIVTLYEGDAQVGYSWGAMGRDQSNGGFYATANGTFYVTAKERALTWTKYGGVYLENYVEFDPERDNGFHSYSMDETGNVIDGGNGPTGGCIALEPWWSDVLFDFAHIGTRVEIHW